MIDEFLHNLNVSLHVIPQNFLYLSPITASPFTVQNSNIDISFFDAMSNHLNFDSLNSTFNIDSCIDAILKNFDHVFLLLMVLLNQTVRWELVSSPLHLT